MKGYEAAAALNQPSWQNILRSFPEKRQRLSSYYLQLQECADFFCSPLNQMEGKKKQRDLEGSPVFRVSLWGFFDCRGCMRDTGWRIHFGVGLLGTSNLAEGNMLPTRVISSASVSEETRAGFAGGGERERGPGKGKEKKKG